MAGTPRLIAGVAAVTINGQQFEIAGEFSYSPSNVKLEVLSGMSGNFQGWKETPTPVFIEYTGRDQNGVPLSTFVNMTNVTVSATLADGRFITAGGMIVTDVVTLNVMDGSFKVRFEGGSVVELLG